MLCQKRQFGGGFWSNFGFWITQQTHVNRHDALVDIWLGQITADLSAWLRHSESQPPTCFVLVGLFQSWKDMLLDFTNLLDVFDNIDTWANSMHLDWVIFII